MHEKMKCVVSSIFSASRVLLFPAACAHPGCRVCAGRAGFWWRSSGTGAGQHHSTGSRPATAPSDGSAAADASAPTDSGSCSVSDRARWGADTTRGAPERRSDSHWTQSYELWGEILEMTARQTHLSVSTSMLGISVNMEICGENITR